MNILWFISARFQNMMHNQALANLVRKQVKDHYGRYLGNIVGFSLDNGGHIKSVAVEQAGGDFAEYASERILIEGEYIILLPDWKDEIERLKRDSALAQKRYGSLEQLSKEGEISTEVFAHLKEKYETEITTLRSSFTNLTEGLKSRIATIEEKNTRISKFIGSLKVQYRTGEIDEQTYRTAMESISQLLKQDAEESNELTMTLTWLTGSSENPAKPETPIAPTISA